MTVPLELDLDSVALGNEMRSRVVAFDWTNTSLGPVESWPNCLRVAVDICLNNRFPMHIWWGPDLVYIYNDGHIPILRQKHPTALGQSAPEVWGDVWMVLAPQVDAVMTRGESTWNARAQVALQRNGCLEDAWFTWSYSPLRDEQGRVRGLICIATENTAEVLAERERDRLEQSRQRDQDRQQAEAAKALRDSDTLLKGISDSTGDVIFAKDRDGRMRFANPAALALIGKPVDQVIGKTDLEFLEDKEAARAAMANDRQVMDAGLSTDFEEAVPLSDGTYRLWFSRKMPYRDSEGKIIGILGIARDITERKAAEDEARRARDAAEVASKAKDRLLSVVSHELRTPLNPILAIASHLQMRDDLPADLRSDVDMIRRNVEQEARIIDDLLNVTRLQTGKILLHREIVDLHKLIRIVVSQFKAQLRLKQINVLEELRASNAFTWADPSRLEQVLSNLLDNAVKFTTVGGSIFIRSSNRSDQEVQIQIEDTGVGIDAEVLPKIFNPFEQGEQTITRRFGGLGLGLAVVKGILDLHGGVIEARSPGRDKGTTMALSLKTLEPSNQTARVTDAASVKPHTAQHRILLVEDHPDTLKIMSRILAGLGYQVKTAMSVKESLDLLALEKFELLLSDIGLPDGSGLEIMRSLRTQSGTKGIALSGFGNEEDVLRSKEAGFVEHLTKPVDVGTLSSALKKALQAA